MSEYFEKIEKIPASLEDITTQYPLFDKIRRISGIFRNRIMAEKKYFRLYPKIFAVEFSFQNTRYNQYAFYILDFSEENTKIFAWDRNIYPKGDSDTLALYRILFHGNNIYLEKNYFVDANMICSCKADLDPIETSLYQQIYKEKTGQEWTAPRINLPLHESEREEENLQLKKFFQKSETIIKLLRFLKNR